MDNQNTLLFYPQSTLKTETKRILVIEDDPSWQAIFSHSLRQCNKGNVRLRFVRSAKQALDVIYKEQNFSLVLSDHLIDGGLTGIELWDMCRAQFSHLPFILISAKKRTDLLSKIPSDKNIPLILKKPFDLKHFRSMIEIYLKKI